MAGKGGGSWKVAYADFVTAMMAFFMVMWIAGQDQKIKEAVAHYFRDPLGGTPIGVSDKPSKSGALFDQQKSGEVPQSQSVAMGRGRSAHTRHESGSATKLVADWIYHDENSQQRWREAAKKAREQARQLPIVREGKVSLDEAATQILAKQIAEEIRRATPTNLEGVHQDLLLNVLAEVNWREIAEDILSRIDD
jgi:flagellar motor protein MotB